MKKIFLSLSLIFGFAVYAEYRHNQQSFIKDSEMAPSQIVGHTTSALPNAKTAEIQKNNLKRESIVESDDRESEYESDDEGVVQNARQIQTAPSKTLLSKTQTALKSSAPSSRMIGMGSNMMTQNVYKNGEYAGNIADAYYGNVQVKAVISGGKITDIQFLDYPNDRQNSIRINAYAMPILKSEAIKTQSAKVDVVSGATATSGAFQESLASALARARN